MNRDHKISKAKNVHQAKSKKIVIDFFIDPPKDMIIKEKGLSAVKIIRAER